jgi:thioredoxin reductase
MSEASLTFDGTPVAIAPGASVAAALIDAFPSLSDAAAILAPEPARIIEPDIAIIGGGAGGLAAAISSARSGASVVVLDERKVPGGQYYKQSANLPPLDAQQAEGLELLGETQDSGAEIIGSAEVWGAFDGPLFLADVGGRALIVRPRAAIVATGAYERPTMVPGWTLPGVMTTGAAQTLWRSYRTLPGKRVVVCGSGPLNAQVALELANGGASVALVAEAGPEPWRHPWTAIKAALLDPVLVRKGLGMLQVLRKRHIPLAYRTRLHRIEKSGEALRVVFRDASGRESSHIVDAVCMNDGFQPQNEILRLLGANMTYDATFGHLRCDRDDGMQTSIPGLYAVGDCTGLGGAPAARLEGEIAGRTAAARLGFGDAHDLFATRRALARQRRFQRALWQLHDVGPRSLADLPPETIICRCEEITLGEITDGLSAAPGHVGTLKRATRVGMGRCQGRYCGPVAAQLVSAATGRPLDDKSHFAPRVPIKPISIASILAAQEALDGDN